MGMGGRKIAKSEERACGNGLLPRPSPPEKETGHDFSGMLQVIQILIL